MTIKAGDKLPESTFRLMTTDGPVAKTTQELFDGRKVALVAVPGAFTPTCHRNHLPSYLENLEALKEKGVEAVLVTAVNDVFVLEAWAKAAGAEGKIEFLSDGNGDFAKAIGLSLDATAFGLGLRSQRYVMLVDNGVVRELLVEDTPAKADTSSATSLLALLG